jgi:hypothetical protein
MKSAIVLSIPTSSHKHSPVPKHNRISQTVQRGYCKQQPAGAQPASAEMLELALHEQKLSPIIKRLQARSRKMAAVFFLHSNFAFRLRNFIMRNMPKRLLGWYFSGAIKAEMKLLEK